MVVADDTQLQQFDTLSGKPDARLDQPLPDTGVSSLGSDVHAPQAPLMRLLDAFSDRKPGDSRQFLAAKGAENRRAGEPCRKAAQRQNAFALEGAAKSLRVAS